MSTARLHRSPDPRLLQRCLLLALLLHVWLVLLFGNAAGTATPGAGLWSRLTVRLQGQGAAPAEATPPASENGAARNAAPAIPSLSPPEDLRAAEPQAISAPPSRLTPADSRLLPAAPAEALALSAPQAPTTPSPELPAAVARLEARPDAAPTPTPSAADLRLSPPALSAPLTASAELPAPVQRLESNAPALTVLPRQGGLQGIATPATPNLSAAALPAAVHRLEATAPALAPLLRPGELRGLPPAAAASTALAGDELPATVQRLEAQAPGTAAPQRPQTLARELRSPAATTAAALPDAQDLPAAVQRLETASAVREPSPPATASSLRALAASPGSATLPSLSGALPGQVAPQASVAARPTEAPSAPRPPLNLSLPRGSALAARRGPGLLELLPQPPEPHKSKMEKAIERAANGDCREAYAGSGLLAVIPLAADAVRNKGCKW